MYDIGVSDCRKAVCDDDGCAVLHKGMKGGLHLPLRVVVECGGSLVKDKYGGILEERTGDADALTLSARESDASVADNSVVAVGQRLYKLIGTCQLSGTAYGFGRGGGVAEGYVVGDGIVEEDAILRDNRDESTKTRNVEAAKVDAVNLYFT